MYLGVDFESLDAGHVGLCCTGLWPEMPYRRLVLHRSECYSSMRRWGLRRASFASERRWLPRGFGLDWGFWGARK